MNRMSRLRLLPALASLLLLGAVSTTGCSKRVTSVDAGYTTVEGISNANARLVAWRETPITYITYRDTAFGDITKRVLVGVGTANPTTPGAMRVQILDGTAASGYQVYRRDANGGYRSLRDYVLTSPRKWTESNWELYTVDDESPSGFSPATYVGRGIVGGTATPSSPLSNVCEVTLAAPTPSISYLATVEPTDSLFTMSWTSVPGAAGYWIHVFQYLPNLDTPSKQTIAAPSPIVNTQVKDYFIGFVNPTPQGLTPPTCSYKLGAAMDASRSEVQLVRRTTLIGQTYQVRISAVDAKGQLIAFMPGDSLRLPSDAGLYPDGTYSLSVGNSVAVQPKRR